MATEIIAIALAFGLSYALVRLRPEHTKRWFRRVMRARQVVGGIFLIALAVFMIGTGVSVLVLVGFAILLYAALFLLLEQPHATIISSVKSALGR